MNKSTPLTQEQRDSQEEFRLRIKKARGGRVVRRGGCDPSHAFIGSIFYDSQNEREGSGVRMPYVTPETFDYGSRKLARDIRFGRASVLAS